MSLKNFNVKSRWCGSERKKKWEWKFSFILKILRHHSICTWKNVNEIIFNYTMWNWKEQKIKCSEEFFILQKKIGTFSGTYLITNVTFFSFFYNPLCCFMSAHRGRSVVGGSNEVKIFPSWKISLVFPRFFLKKTVKLFLKNS